MRTERKALVLSHVHSKLLIGNLDIALHELKVNKNPGAKKIGLELSKLRYATTNAFREINKEIERQGGMESLEEEINEIMDKTWNDLDADEKAEDIIAL